MDTSEQYVKMCDCEEIQGGKETLTVYDYIGEPWVWLPRQDQLQEMVNSDGVNKYNQPAMLDRLLKFAKDYDIGFKVDDSMEQLWLAFVMKERHQKVWSGNKWIKEG